MDESKVKQIVQGELYRSQYNVTSVPFHTHNGVDSPKVSGVNISGLIPSNSITYTPNSGSTATLLCDVVNEHRVVMPAGNAVLAVSGDTFSQKFIVSITQDSGGSRTVTWFSTIRWAGGTTPTLTTTGSKRDTFWFIRTGTATYDGFILGQNI